MARCWFGSEACGPAWDWQGTAEGQNVSASWAGPGRRLERPVLALGHVQDAEVLEIGGGALQELLALGGGMDSRPAVSSGTALKPSTADPVPEVRGGPQHHGKGAGQETWLCRPGLCCSRSRPLAGAPLGRNNWASSRAQECL